MDTAPASGAGDSGFESRAGLHGEKTMMIDKGNHVYLYIWTRVFANQVREEVECVLSYGYRVKDGFRAVVCYAGVNWDGSQRGLQIRGLLAG